MLAKPFDHAHAKCLLKATRTSKYWKIDVQGVWPKKSESEPDFESDFEPDAESQVGPGIDKEFDYWVPVNVFARDENAPDCANTPALSFPFDARDLAAFMLYGNGCLIAEYYGGWQNGPDSERLDALLPDNFSRRAVKEAFEAYREAQRIVDPYPLELDAKAERARKAWNDADSETDKETKAVRGLEMEATAAEAKAAQGKWLEDMVRVLLKPAQEQTAATSAPVVADSGKKLPAWLDVTGNYIAGIMKDGQIVNAKLLYRALEAKAGPESPFDKGTGQNRGSLYVRKIAAPVSLKTMQNNWSKIRSLA